MKAINCKKCDQMIINQNKDICQECTRNIKLNKILKHNLIQQIKNVYKSLTGTNSIIIK